MGNDNLINLFKFSDKLPDDEFAIYEYLTEIYNVKFERLKTRFEIRLNKIKEQALTLFPTIDLSNLHLTFEDCFNDTNEEGSIYARCSNLATQEIDINIYHIANFYFKEYSNLEILQFYKSHRVLVHEVAHIIDYQLNGDKDLSKQHDETFMSIFKTLNRTNFYEEIMQLTQFNLLCESIEDELKTATVDYMPLTAIVHKTIAEYLNLPYNEFESLYRKRFIMFLCF